MDFSGGGLGPPHIQTGMAKAGLHATVPIAAPAPGVPDGTRASPIISPDSTRAWRGRAPLAGPLGVNVDFKGDFKGDFMGFYW